MKSISFLPGEHPVGFFKTSGAGCTFRTFLKGSRYLHLTQQGVVTGVGGEVLLKDRHSAGESHVSTATEQGDPREAEDGGNQRGIGDSSQTLDAAFEAAWTQRRENAVTSKMHLVFTSITC